MKRNLINLMTTNKYSCEIRNQDLEYCIYKHNSLIMRKLGNENIDLQINKKKNLHLTSPKIDGIIVKPGEVFSFWNLVGKCSKQKGYLSGVTISNGKVTPGVAGGLCQMTNLIHWMILHSPLDIVEHHHHHKYDIFPDFKRQIPFGTGTSIMYNYLDYQFANMTEDTFQIRVRVSNQHLEGELRVNNTQKKSYHIVEKNSKFVKEENNYYRCNDIYRKIFNKRTGLLETDELIISNKSLVLYDAAYIDTEVGKTLSNTLNKSLNTRSEQSSTEIDRMS